MMLASYLMRKLGGREEKAQFFAKYDAFFPKSRKKAILVIKARTEFSGNMRVCADVLLASKKHKVYVYKDGPMSTVLEKALKAQGIKILKHKSWRSFYHLFTSGLMFFSHVPRDAHITIKDQRRTIIGLWHGVAFKNIESQMISVPAQKLALIANNAKLYDLMIASSLKDKQYLAKSFMVAESIIQITGLPRYDLLKTTYPLDSFLSAQKQKLCQIKANKKLVLYAPTFREKSASHLDQITESEWGMLNEFMVAHNSVLGVRPHPYDKKDPPSIFDSLGNVAWLDHEGFTESNAILQQSDIMVVDFSSIWIDYLLLNRPIVGFAKDFEHYRDAERGFAYDFSDTFPDVFAKNVDELINRLGVLLDNNVQSKYYSAAKQTFHAFDLSTDFSAQLNKAIKPYLA